MAKRKSYIGKCVFCGSTGSVTDDHVPPKAIFAKPRPSDLITVPGCKKCNQGWSLDDEYFRTALCLSNKTADERNATDGRRAAMRSLQREEAKGLAKMFLSRTFPKEVYSPEGIYLGKRLAFTVDFKRIQKVVAKITRGLFYKESGRILPKNYSVSVDSNDTLEQMDANQLHELQDIIIKPLLSTQERIVGDGTFRYRHAIPDDGDGFVSVWALTFYGTMPFLCICGPGNSASKGTEPGH
jgi:hypothetical protein